jgi:hypothetical protein
LLILDAVPKELLAYLDRDRRFCKWFVEVAWQRLSDAQRTPKLAKHWSRFGDLTSPKHEVIPVDDKWDDWRGIGEIYFPRWTDLRQEASEIKIYLRLLARPELFQRVRSLKRRTVFRSEIW